MGIIYCIRNKETGARYIGQSRNSLGDKKKQYVALAYSKRKSDRTWESPLFAAIREYGVDSFEWSIILDDVPESDLDQLEKDFISIHKSTLPGGYNLRSGGVKGSLHSDKTKEKLSKTQTKVWERRKARKRT